MYSAALVDRFMKHVSAAYLSIVMPELLDPYPMEYE